MRARLGENQRLAFEIVFGVGVDKRTLNCGDTICRFFVNLELELAITRWLKCRPHNLLDRSVKKLTAFLGRHGVKPALQH